MTRRRVRHLHARLWRRRAARDSDRDPWQQPRCPDGGARWRRWRGRGCRVGHGVRERRQAGTGPEFAVAHLAWAPDGRRLAYAVTDQHSVAVLDTATARSQADAVDVNADRERFPGCLTSPTWGPDHTLLMLGVEPSDQCDARWDAGTKASVVAFHLDTAEIERRRPAPLVGVLRADASGRHLLLSGDGDLAIVELRPDGTTREISRQAGGADW